MEAVIKLAAVAVVAATLIDLLSQYNHTYAILASVSICCGMLLVLLNLASPLFGLLQQLAAASGQEDLACVLKALGIAILTQTAADICSDSGQKAMAGRVILAGRVAVLAGALPLFAKLADLVQGLLAY
ncbi:MAG: stage III sporulation AC/AD family protein [Pygmaiobacter massiliensis]|nr:stage III sporulation AC/AD family protein [Pygmaiobacter massiliensis]